MFLPPGMCPIFHFHQEVRRKKEVAGILQEPAEMENPTTFVLERCCNQAF